MCVVTVSQTAGAAIAGTAHGRRAVLGLVAVSVAGVDLAAKAWAQRSLSPAGIDLPGPLDLRLGYNSGVAFSLGADLPEGVMVAVTAAVTLTVGVAAWHLAATAGAARIIALSALLGGAAANLADRVGDGVVTDYLHTGWWPTFNLADTAIVLGAALLVVHSLRAPDPAPAG